MLKLCLAVTLTFLVIPFAQADDVSDAAKALETKSYAEAFRLYSKAAAAGNPQAQFQLGDMYFYGEGVPADQKLAVEWFRKAAARGNKEAVAAQTRIDQRRARGADIQYWTSKYDGADLAQGPYACVTPVIPDVSKTTADITKVSAEYGTWRDCHNGFIDHLSAALPAGKAIPSDIEVLMTDAELTRARERLEAVYRRIGGDKASAASKTVAKFDKWSARTNAAVSVINEQRLATQRQNDQIFADVNRTLLHPYRENPVDRGSPVGPKDYFTSRQ